MVVVARALGDSNAMSATLEIPMINCELFFIIQSPLIPFNKILPPLAAGRLEWRGEETASPPHSYSSIPCSFVLILTLLTASRKHQIDLWSGPGGETTPTISMMWNSGPTRDSSFMDAIL